MTERRINSESVVGVLRAGTHTASQVAAFDGCAYYEFREAR